MLIVGTWFLAVAILWVILADGSEWFFDLGSGLANAGVSGLVLFGIVAMLACVAFVPVTVLALAAGFAFGILRGALTVSVAGTLGAGLAFLLGRTLLRPWVESQPRSRQAALPRPCGSGGTPRFPGSLADPSISGDSLQLSELRLRLDAHVVALLPGGLMARHAAGHPLLRVRWSNRQEPGRRLDRALRGRHAPLGLRLLRRGGNSCGHAFRDPPGAPVVTRGTLFGVRIGG